ncbi:BafA family autotransporter [Bartonella taylorii]|nr:BafA family autotransporter [Bartonella taylorii]USP02061.1 BafA family autotransporter [Bartonella taylorii]
MQHKCKLGFSVLIVSSCLVQIVNADEKRNEELTNVTSVTSGGKVPKGSALTHNSFSNNITIEDGGVEIVESGGSSIGVTVKKGGMQIVTRGGIATDAKVLGGKQFIYEEKGLDLTSVERKSSAYNTIVSGEDGVIGQQNVYDGAWVWNTKVKGRGEQNLYMGHRKEGGRSMNTEVSGNGRQHVLMGGESYGTTLQDSAVQVVYPGGFLDGLTINGTAGSWLHVGVQEVVGEVRVNDSGKLYLFAGDVTDHITKEKLSIEGRSDEIFFLVGDRNNKEKPQIKIEDLGGQDGTVIFTSIPYDPQHISLHVERLSGSLHFRFNLSATGDASDYLSITEGSGNHKISVTDSGAEITGLFSQKNSLITEIPLITDRGQNEGANFTLEDRTGKEIATVDGGTYQYQLLKRDRCASSSGNFTNWYLGRVSENSEPSNTETQCVNKKTKIPLALSAGNGTWPQQGASSGRKNTNSRKHTKKQPAKPRPPRHLREAKNVSSVSVSSTQGNQVIEVSGSARPHHLSDTKQQTAISEASQSLADQMILRPSDQDQPFTQLGQEPSVSHFLTTPSTDAVLSMSVVPQLVFHNELQTVRAGRGILDRNKKNAALWTYAIKSKENIATGHTDFKLEQTGVVLGITGLSELTNGEFYIGGFGSYDQARVAHARGGISGITTYSIGAYATYFDHSGWYVDSILKYNRYQNGLKAVSTNGLDIEGNYTQWAVGSSFEAGYRIKTSKSSWLQPYAQFTWMQVEGKEIKLSNKMTGDIRPSISLRSEVGLSLGYEFGLGIDTSSLAYITAAWLRENKDNNRTTINKLHKFTTDLSGNVGKLGVGLSSLVSDKLKLYAEAHYVKGRKVKQSLQGILGVRYSF